MKPFATLCTSVMLCCIVHSFTLAQPVNKSDSLVLVDLYNSTNGPGWLNNSGWLNGPVALWSGIFVEDGRVTWINMTSNNLSGPIPASIGKLSKLKVLLLTFNSITGDFPASFRRLSELEDLGMARVTMETQIPAYLGRLPKLRTLYLSGRFKGRIPAGLGKAGNLEVLYINGNPELHGRIPASLGRLSRVKDLNLADNDLSGQIPGSFRKLSAVAAMDLRNNRLRGHIPRFLGRLNQLGWLYLGGNQFGGRIPSSLGELPNLAALDLATNKLRGHIPLSLCKPPLGSLFLNSNRLSGRIPDSLVNPSELFLDHNQLSGPVPAAVIDKFRIWPFSLRLEYNRFTFDGLENVRQRSNNTCSYFEQASIPLKRSGNVLYVDAGGTLSNNSYIWWKDGVQLVRKVGDSTYTATGSGYYYARAHNNTIQLLSLFSDTVFVKVDTLSNRPVISPVRLKKPSMLRFLFYPNPVVHTLYLRIVEDKTSGPMDISIIDMNQRVVLQKRIAAISGQSFIPVDISPLTSGVYILTVRNGGRQGSQRLVKVAGR
ncbi:T9SS type A sorting domain-containing protein [Chitinophaga agrisoli]|uniref:T9SS type A sorting domain-containing protein n=1 Tax=Chitinophaga agrisoli TaxID=2607653 RepID=A0A5B2VUI8_9BACT|nr:T9SS type A sorting domain-containing protein [Chitinophaga agrisoli]KAA2242735.1 T9SS type A sorting domain-containing protein [Chitinophaga agrisoli]